MRWRKAGKLFKHISLRDSTKTHQFTLWLVLRWSCLFSFMVLRYVPDFWTIFLQLVKPFASVILTPGSCGYSVASVCEYVWSSVKHFEVLGCNKALSGHLPFIWFLFDFSSPFLTITTNVLLHILKSGHFQLFLVCTLTEILVRRTEIFENFSIFSLQCQSCNLVPVQIRLSNERNVSVLTFNDKFYDQNIPYLPRWAFESFYIKVVPKLFLLGLPLVYKNISTTTPTPAPVCTT